MNKGDGEKPSRKAYRERTAKEERHVNRKLKRLKANRQEKQDLRDLLDPDE